VTRISGSVQRFSIRSSAGPGAFGDRAERVVIVLLNEMSIRSCRVNVEASELFHSVSIVLFLIGVTVWVVSRDRKGRIRQAVGTSSAVPISKFEWLAERRKETLAAHMSQICLSGPWEADNLVRDCIGAVVVRWTGSRTVNFPFTRRKQILAHASHSVNLWPAEHRHPHRTTPPYLSGLKLRMMFPCLTSESVRASTSWRTKLNDFPSCV